MFVCSMVTQGQNFWDLSLEKFRVIVITSRGFASLGGHEANLFT